MAHFELDEAITNQARIKVIGVGGGGGNAVNTMIASGLDGVEFIAGNTDSQVLLGNLAATKIQLGAQLTRGLGAGGDPEVGRSAALEERERIAEAISEADMVFVTAGMGGGTGTGAAPIIAQVARDQGILTVGVVTRPFPFEGKRRMRQAEEGVTALAQAVDCLLVIPNAKLLEVAGNRMAFTEAFRMADEVLLNAVRGICDIITVPGLVNVDFADVRTIMTNKGRALMGTGRAKGGERTVAAAKTALASPLIEDARIDGATGILVNITGAPDMTLNEVAEAMALITEAAHENAHCIFGSVCNSNMKDEVQVTVIATGFDQASAKAAPPPAPRRAQLKLQMDGEGDYGQAPDAAAGTGRFRRDTGPAPAAPAPATSFARADLTNLDTPTYLRKGTGE